MIDIDEIRTLIMQRKPFKIGARGICIMCLPHLYPHYSPKEKGWSIRIPRASVAMDVEDIDVLDDTDYYLLTYRVDVSKYGPYHSFADLTEYDKLTVIE